MGVLKSGYSMAELLKYYLPVFVTLYLLFTFVIPSVRVYEQTGINTVTFSNTDNAHDYIGAVMKIITRLLVVVVLLFSVDTGTYRYLNPFEYLQKKWLCYSGLIIIHSALIWIIFAQYHMKQSWRIGIDTNSKTTLI